MTCGNIEYWIDHASEHPENNGIQRVSRYLARGLEDLGQDRGFELEFRCWDERRKRPRPATRREIRKFGRWNGPQRSSHSTKWWWRSGRTCDWLLVPEVTYTTREGVLRGADLAADLIAEARARGLKTAFLFHDLLPVTIGDDEPQRLRHEQYARALSKADLLLPVSSFAAEELRAFFRARDLLAPRIDVCRLATEFVRYQRVTTVCAPEGGGLVEILCVSSMSPRKNQHGLLRAFTAFCRKHPNAKVRLTLVGHFFRPWLDEIERLAEGNPSVVIAGYRDDDGLAELYRRADFTVFPSIAEGYGMPIVESLWFGKPCLCANFDAMAEVGSDGGCFLVDTRSDEALEDGLTRLILDTALRRRLTLEAVARPMTTWLEYARRVLAAIDRASGRPEPELAAATLESHARP